MSKRLVPGVLAAAALTTAVVALPPTGATAEAVAPVTTLVFDKNPADPTRSTLTVYKDGVARSAPFRAGSGLGVTDECVRNKGWIPNGNWKIKLKDKRYNGQLIKGYAILLANMKCARNSTPRTEMFIHSEMNRDGSQGRTEARRWDGAGDYKSNGCVKLSPSDITELFTLLNDIGWPTHLRVVS
ncbi:L,D-transpeptidase [Streptomyces sp. NPDC048428]|uniref:L,D-transpeptidase n=1 Tax=Streptomyces sp. NPDC048428 TaxID=3154503 RepID=UPI00343F3001